jgi:hypothetical protein
MGANYPILITVSADLPKERTPAKDEKPEDKQKLDQQFQEKQKQLGEKLAKEKKVENWTYLISKGTIEAFIKDRTALFPEKKTSPSPAPGLPSPTPAKRKPR